MIFLCSSIVCEVKKYNYELQSKCMYNKARYRSVGGYIRGYYEIHLIIIVWKGSGDHVPSTEVALGWPTPVEEDAIAISSVLLELQPDADILDSDQKHQ